MTQGTLPAEPTGDADVEEPAAPVAPKHPVRADIQGLRAIAVASVVVFHFWPSLLPGGFTGVDVFFVVSGFLITSQILRDVDRFGAGAFAARFWAARIRRILPAATVVLVFVLIASYYVMPVSQWAEVGRHALASAVSLENWMLAAQSVDYGAEGASPTPVQHYWSLSVEEQFYLFWPILLLVGALIAKRWSARLRRRRVIAVIMGMVLVASLVYSFYVTYTNPGPAYFVTPARIWQLAAGGFIALVAVRGYRLAPWVGLVLIGLGMFVITVDTPYPGFAALLPTVGTCLVLLGGPSGRFSFDRVSSPWPIQHLGDISYSVYLWHWPLLILAPLALGRALSTGDMLLLLVLTLGISELSYRLVEQPFRKGWLLRTTPRAWGIGALAVAVVVAGSYTFASAGETRTAAATAEFEKLIQSPTGCFGAAALDNGCADPFAPVSQSAALAGHNDLPMASRKPRCSDDLGPYTQVLCHYGDPAGTRTILLWGNSHAAAWSDALDEVGKRLGMKVVVASRSGCPSSTQPPPPNELRENTAEDLLGCKQRNEWVLSTLVPQAQVVVMADLRAGYADGSRSLDGYVEAVSRARASGAQVIWLSDVPLTDGVTSRIDGPECLQLHGQCSNPVDRALLARGVTIEMEKRVPDLKTIDVSSRFCDDQRCYSAVGGVSVYFDGLHLSGTYSRSLGPWLARQIGGCLAERTACVQGVR